MRDEYLLKDSSELREIIGRPSAKLSEKITGELDAYQSAFVAKAPIAFVSTADSNP